MPGLWLSLMEGRWLAGHAALSVPVIAGCSKQWWRREGDWGAVAVLKARPCPEKE